MDTGLRGKVAVVTGSGRTGGIGQAVAAALAAEGAKIVLSDIGRPFDDFPDYEVAERSDIERCARLLREGGTEVEIVFADVAKEEDVASLVAKTAARFGRLDVMVNNAGIGLGLVPIVELTVDAWRRNLDVEALKASILPQIPLARFQKPEDVADAVLFLASKQGRYVTGEALNSTGGQEMH